MAKQLPSSESQPDSKRIDAFLRLAASAPDEDRLRRFFAESTSVADADSLTDTERRWVTTNLAAHPGWQESWRRLEEEYGRAVAWTPPPVASAAAARDRPSARRRRLLPGRGVARPTLMVLFALVLLYGVLWAAGRLSLPETYTVASVSGYENVLGANARNTDAEEQSDFAIGAAALLAAPRSTLGLFPHYDPAQVERALTHFRRAFDQTPDPFQRAEIAFFLVKASLMQDDVPAARAWLEQVPAQNVADYRDEAAALLQRLDEQSVEER